MERRRYDVCHLPSCCCSVMMYIYIMHVLKETENGTRRESLTPLQHCQWFLFCQIYVPPVCCGKLINALKEVPSKETSWKYYKKMDQKYCFFLFKGGAKQRNSIEISPQKNGLKIVFSACQSSFFFLSFFKQIENTSFSVCF